MPWQACAQGPGDETSTATHAARASAQLRPLSLTAQTPRLPTRRGHAGCGVHSTERGGGRAEPGALTPACPMTPPGHPVPELLHDPVFCQHSESFASPRKS